MGLVDVDSFFTGISEKDWEEIQNNSNDLSIIVPDKTSLHVMTKTIRNGSTSFQHSDKSRAYRLGTGAYFVHDQFVIARNYSRNKAARSSSDEIILKISLKRIFEDQNTSILNLLKEDGHYLFYKTCKRLKQPLENSLAKLQGATPQEFNLDAIIIDYLVDETRSKNSIRLVGVASIVQEAHRLLPYTNKAFSRLDVKSNPTRHITGITPLDHVEVMIIKDYCNKIEILEVYNDSEISLKLSSYDQGFLDLFEM